MPEVIVKKGAEPKEVQDWLRTTEGFLRALTEIDEKPTRLGLYQEAFLAQESKFRAVEKARGIGFSFICAVEGGDVLLVSDYSIQYRMDDVPVKMDLTTEYRLARHDDGRWHIKSVISDRR